MRRKILIAGVHGVIGRAAAIHLSDQPDTQVIGLSRRTADALPNVEAISVDLLDLQQVQSKLKDVKDVTHIIFGAYIEKQSAAEKSEFNVAILRNLLDVVEASSPSLEHVTFYQGGKAYGADLGAFKTPAREDDPRLMPPNFYYDQEDLLRERQQNKNWSFTALRPEAVCGFAVGNPMNLLTVIAVYAAISKELGIPLRFPGTQAAYTALYQLSSADILAQAADWAGTSPLARNEIFNLTNGDYFRWQHMWPKIAKMFDMEWTDPISMPLATYMTDKAPIWTKMSERYGLQDIPYEQIASWPFGDFIFASGFDNISSTIKVRQAGFHACIDTEYMFEQQFAQLRADRIIPEI
jgi:nucleoside-diphosphate-sugar epimerase